MDNTVQDLATLISPLLALCLKAGDVISHHYSRPDEVEISAKGDDSPLTEADLDSHHLLLEGLTSLTPTVPVLSEESDDADKARRFGWSRLWLVDPLDGTREFVERTGEFTVNLALIDNHRPVLGVLYQPLEQTAWVGIPGLLSRRYQYCAQTGQWQFENTATRKLQCETGVTVLASRRHRGDKLKRCVDWIEDQVGPTQRRNSGSAVKFCQLADGLGDIYPRFVPCCEWDTAAGQAVLEAAGGALLGLDGEPLRYNAGDSLFSPNFYALAQPGHSLWQRLLGGN